MNNHTPVLIDNPIEERFEFTSDGSTAFIEYTPLPGVMILTYAFVPKSLQGGGVGAAMVKAALGEIKARGLQVVPQCNFVSLYIQRHPEWESLLYKKAGEKVNG